MAIILSGMLKNLARMKDWLEDMESLQRSAVLDDVNFCLSSVILLCRSAGGETAEEVSKCLRERKS